MKSTQMLGLLVAAGALGAVAGGAVATMTERTDEGPDTALVARLDEVVRGVESLREAAGDLRNDVADVRERIVAVELELSRRRSLPSTAAVVPEGSEEGAAAPDGMSDEVKTALLRARALDLEKRIADVAAAVPQATAMKERFTKGMRIRAMPEDQRWQHAADTLGLNSVQVDELKAAHQELQDGLKAAIVEETTEAGGGVTTFRRVDGNKMRDAQQAFQSRVDNALNDEQKKAWHDEGFGHAMGRSRGAAFIAPRRLRAVDVGSGDGRTGTATIEIVTTEVLEGTPSDD